MEQKGQDMTAKPTIILVGADKGGVGKTTVCRALIDYLIARKVSQRIFDTEFPKGDLAMFYPGSPVVDFGAIKGQMQVFDGVCNESVTVVDIRAGVLSPILKTLDEAHFLDDVRSGEVALVILHVLGPSIASLSEVLALTKTIGAAARHLIVKNHINETQFDLAQDSRYSEFFRIAEPGTINVPNIPSMATERIQQVSQSFATFVADPTMSRMLRGHVRGWLDKVWAEFDRVGLGSML
jgi:hypothetical protein